MPRIDYTYLCTCELYPDGHNVRKSSKTVHSLELKNHKEKALRSEAENEGSQHEAQNEDAQNRAQLAKPDGTGLAGLLSGLHISDSYGSADTPASDTADDQGLSDMLAGVILSEDEPVNASNPAAKRGVVMLDAVQESIHKLVLRHPFEKAAKSPSLNTSPQWGDGTTRSAHERKHISLLNSVQVDIQELNKTLGGIDGQILSDERKLGALLHDVANKIRGLGVTLADGFNNPSDLVSSRKQDLLAALSSDVRAWA
ncbi:hypothetical protein CPC08DRAFT_715664 [Agrocybe pediades]|nr:hypothetical protein CPC08DRAFT_715664 [Agrocybe pediades]